MRVLAQESTSECGTIMMILLVPLLLIAFVVTSIGEEWDTVRSTSIVPTLILTVQQRPPVQHLRALETHTPTVLGRSDKPNQVWCVETVKTVFLPS